MENANKNVLSYVGIERHEKANCYLFSMSFCDKDGNPKIVQEEITSEQGDQVFAELISKILDMICEYKQKMREIDGLKEELAKHQDLLFKSKLVIEKPIELKIMNPKKKRKKK